MRKLMYVGAVLLTAGAAGAQPTPLFRAAKTFNLPGSKGDYVGAVALADIGAPSGSGAPDGFLDVVTLNRSNGKADTLFGKGDGTFAAGPSTTLGIIPAALALADFNGDGPLDLLVADSLSSSVVFLRGFDDGPPFGSPSSPIPAGPFPVAIVAADLNRDDHMDAIVVNSAQQSSGITILLGVGNGTFSTSDLIPAGSGSAAAVVATFDGDLNPDVAVANADSNDVSIFAGDGTGSVTLVQTVSVGTEPVAIAAGNLNGGAIDLITANRSGDSVSVLNGRGNGRFDSARSFPSGSVGSSPVSLTLADVNDDGNLDVLVANRQSADVSVLLGDGTGDLAPPRAFLGDEEPEAVAAGDLNGDGVDDAVTVDQGSGVFANVAALLSRVDGSFSAIENVITQPNPVAVTAGDVNNDGICDLIVGHSGEPAGDLLVFRARPEGGFAPPAVLMSSGDVVGIGRGDFNRDGLLDLAALNRSTNALSVFLGAADGSFAAAQTYPAGDTAASALVVGDWNRDGRDDVAITLQGTDTGGMLSVLLANTDGSFGPPTSLVTGQAPLAIDYGDFNRDGNLDLAIANNVSNDVWLYRGNGAGSFQAVATVSSPGGPRALAVADFDRDGFDDIAVARQRTGVSVLYGDAQGGFSPGPPVTLSGSAAAMSARDVSGDMIPDLLVADEVSNALVALIGSGTRGGGFQRENYTVSRGPRSTVAADLDGDGRYDAATANSFVAGTASVLTNVQAPAVLRGDGNSDGRRSAADTVAVSRELDDNPTRRVEVAPAGGYPAGLGIDANGDGSVTPQDVAAVIHRLFEGS